LLFGKLRTNTENLPICSNRPDFWGVKIPHLQPIFILTNDLQGFGSNERIWLMAASLDGIIFDQFYGDNSGGAAFDTDGDGNATQEDEFVSFTNTSGAPVDLSGWQIWSDMSGAGAPDGPQDGLYHTFSPGTVLNPGQRLYVVNEITGTPAGNMQEASEGGVESGAGGTNTNFLTEGDGSSSQPESVALVNPSTGEYIILNFSATEASTIPGLSGFPGTLPVGESNAASDSGVEDQNSGSSYQYNSTTGSYEYAAVTVMCYAPDTCIDTPTGPRAVQTLQPGDLVHTLDHGPQPICSVRSREHPLATTGSHATVESGGASASLSHRRTGKVRTVLAFDDHN